MWSSLTGVMQTFCVLGSKFIVNQNWFIPLFEEGIRCLHATQMLHAYVHINTFLERITKDLIQNFKRK